MVFTEVFHLTQILKLNRLCQDFKVSVLTLMKQAINSICYYGGGECHPTSVTVAAFKMCSENQTKVFCLTFVPSHQF